jgi:hypothetical protein
MITHIETDVSVGPQRIASPTPGGSRRKESDTWVLDTEVSDTPRAPGISFTVYDGPPAIRGMPLACPGAPQICVNGEPLLPVLRLVEYWWRE